MTEAKTLTPQQQQAAVLLGSGVTQADIARRLKVNVSTVQRWKQLPAFREATDAALDDALLEAKGFALDVLVKQLHSDNAFVAQNAARDILNRAGVTGAQAGQPRQVNVVFNGLEIGEAEGSDS